MNVKVKAGVIVVGIVVVAMAVSSALKLVAPYITPEIAFNIMMFGSMAVLLYAMYNLILTNLEVSKEYKNKLEEMVNKK